METNNTFILSQFECFQFIAIKIVGQKLGCVL